MMRSTEKLGRRVGSQPHVDAKWKRLQAKPRMKTFRIYPDPARREVVEVRILPTARAMQAAFQIYEHRDSLAPNDHLVMGRCQSWHCKYSGRALLRPGLVVARIYYSAADLQQNPSEISSHEAGHAAMAYARWLGVDLSRMQGEEVMVHALGRLVSQVNRVLFAAGVWGREPPRVADRTEIPP
jgi:hypothetical protein